MGQFPAQDIARTKCIVNTQNISPLNHFAALKAFSYARMAEGKDNEFEFIAQIGEGGTSKVGLYQWSHVVAYKVL